MSRGGQVGAWLELMRAGNAPTVVSNVLAGAAAGALAQPGRAGLPLVVLVQVLLGALLTTFFPGMVSAFAPGYVFLFFCGMMVLQLVWVHLMVPETKGVPLEEIEQRLIGTESQDVLIGAEGGRR